MTPWRERSTSSVIVALPPDTGRTTTGPEGAAVIFCDSVDGLTFPDSSMTPLVEVVVLQPAVVMVT